MIFATTINGIPCFCRVDHYSPGRPDKVSGSIEDAEEGYDEEFEFTVLDHLYRIATWLQKQITSADENRLLEEFHITLLEEKHIYGVQYD